MALPTDSAPDTPARSRGEGDVLQIIDRYQAAVVQELHALLDGRTTPPYTLMRYHLGWENSAGRPIEGRGGKLLRPGLCLLCCEAVGGDWPRAVPAAAALELTHNFTLIHDDVEDTSSHRHGRETLWSLWGEAQAINAGDGMFALAHATLLRLEEHGHAPERVLQAAALLDKATLLLCEGQHRDLLYMRERQITCEAYLEMIEGKTAALIAASCGIGALLGGAPATAIDALCEYGRHTGLAFQIRDDMLGIWGDPKETGKPTSDDLRDGKQSYPVVAALQRASPEQRGTLQALLAAVAPSDADVERARDLIERIGARDASEQAAAEHAGAAVAALDAIELPASWREELARLATFAARRRS